MECLHFNACFVYTFILLLCYTFKRTRANEFVNINKSVWDLMIKKKKYRLNRNRLYVEHKYYYIACNAN